MARGRRPSTYSSLAGEFLVLGELALRGLDGTLTLGHTKGVDILVHNPKLMLFAGFRGPVRIDCANRNSCTGPLCYLVPKRGFVWGVFDCVRPVADFLDVGKT